MKSKKIEIHMDPSINADAKNIDGIEGYKCNNCGGYGFTMNIKGGRIPCKDCDQTGVRLPDNRELQNQVSRLSREIDGLKKALIKTLADGGVELET